MSRSFGCITISSRFLWRSTWGESQMPFVIPLKQAQSDYPQFVFIRALTPSEQKAAFHVRDTAGQEFCLKIISPGYDIDRLDREIWALQSISHPNVAKLMEYVFSSKLGKREHYILEEFIAGKDLS